MPRKLTRDWRIALADQISADTAESYSWPDPRFRHDILGFVRLVWPHIKLTDRQAANLVAMAEESHVTIRGGRKSGKTFCGGLLVWWYICTFADARVVLMGPTEDSIDRVIWRQIVQFHRDARISLGGDMHIKARDGWRDGPREIFGRAPRDAGGVRGVSGANVMYVVDEASDVLDEIWSTIDGNMGGSIGEGRNGKALLISNPTRLQGFFYRSHMVEGRWHRIHMPAEARDDIPGMTGSIWIEQMRDYYGEESDHYIVHVTGNFPSVEADRIIHDAWLIEAEARKPEPAYGADLAIGLDPATSETNDECTFAVRRGQAITAIHAHRGLDYEAIAHRVASLAQSHRRIPHEIVRVVLDAQGPIGQGTLAALRQIAQRENLQVVPLYYDRFRRSYPLLARQYEDLNAARWGYFAQRLRGGLAIPFERLLHDELLFPSYVPRENGKRGMTRKDDFRDTLNRSPDRADAVINACWDMQDQLAQSAMTPPDIEEDVQPYHGALSRPRR
jgi:hypothetical protein